LLHDSRVFFGIFFDRHVLITDSTTDSFQVLALNRPSERADLSLTEIQAAAHHEGRVTGVECNLLDFSSVQRAAEAISKEPTVLQRGLDVLCNNAGEAPL
jgi:NAD(P)-dependent dehydrogenase (short-subunit alcohol dehydrogenase family)